MSFMDRDIIAEKYCEIKEVAEAGGYKLHPDEEFCKNLVAGILKNEKRYGIEACPCRLVRGEAKDNLDIVCPCYYRDEDLAQYGACFCALYVGESFDGERQIPDRRQAEKAGAKENAKQGPKLGEIQLKYPVWRCSVCGYLCAKNDPPAKCPVCKAASERFERFI